MFNIIQAGIRRDAGDASAQGWNAPAGAESAGDGAISSDSTGVASSTVQCSGLVFEEKRGAFVQCTFCVVSPTVLWLDISYVHKSLLHPTWLSISYRILSDVRRLPSCDLRLLSCDLSLPSCDLGLLSCDQRLLSCVG